MSDFREGQTRLETADTMTSSHIFIPDRLESASEEEANNSSGSGSGNNSPTLGTSFFGKPSELGNKRIKKVRHMRTSVNILR